jgi:predicted ATPase/DNA-binding SARP family transcriptional activator
MDFRILGALEVSSDGEALDLGGHKQRELLAVLLLHANEVVSHDRLIDALWEDDPPGGARKALQMHVSGLRKVLGRDRVQTKASGYLLRLEHGELDLNRFLELQEQGKLHEALSLWRGPALADFHYRRFAQAEIARIEELRLAALEERIDGDLASGRQAELVGELEALVQANPLRERLRAQLMLSLYRCGRQADALEAYQQARQALVDGLGIEPARPLRKLHQQILKQDEVLDSAQPPRELAPRLQAGLSELPFALDRLVGRTAELAEVGELVRGDVRLLTLTGPGGTGKTRLALEVARTSAPAFDEGARIVSLAPLADPELVLPTITRALGIRALEGESEPEAIRRVLEDASLLLVLDNYEHLLEAAPVASRLAAAIPQLTILSTSRAPLHVTGEHLWPVFPLDLPEPDSSRDPAELGKFAAVALFVDRARAVQPTFELAGENAAAVAEICVRLDGLPLAIELAAARVGVLPPKTMLSRFDRALPLLGSGPRDAPERQRTLESTIRWSYDLLAESHRKLFRRFSVFSGGWTSEAATAVCDGSPDDIGALVETNLVRQAGVDGEQRFTMLRTIREFAHDRLAEAREQAEAEQRHAEYFLALAQQAEGELMGPERADWLARLELEHDNLRAALASGLSLGDSQLALRLACSLWRFWHTHGHLVEGARWLTRSLEAADSPPPALTANALQLAAQLHLMLGNLVEARALAEQSVELSREHGDRALRTAAIDTLALVHLVEGDLDAAESLLQEVGKLTRQTGNRHREATSMISRGYIALVREDFERAETLFQASRELLSEVGERGDEGLALMNLALVSLRDDHRYVEAVGLLSDGLAACEEVGSKRGLSYCFEILGAMAAKRDRSVDAARLLACAEQLRGEIGVQLEAYEQELHDSTAAYALDALGADQLVRERERGRDMTLEEACAYAHGLCEVLASTTGREVEPQ